MAVACALASTLTQQALDPEAVRVGKIGLVGEVRPVPRIEERLREAARCGLRCAVLPARDAARAGAAGLGAVPVRSVEEALERLLDVRPEPARARRPLPGGGAVRA